MKRMIPRPMTLKEEKRRGLGGGRAARSERTRRTCDAEALEFMLSPTEITAILQLSRRGSVSSDDISVYGLAGDAVRTLLTLLVSRRIACYPSSARGRPGDRSGAGSDRYLLTAVRGVHVRNVLKSAGWGLETVEQRLDVTAPRLDRFSLLPLVRLYHERWV